MASVIISGAGPAGALLGYLLAERGVDVTLLERHRTFDREFRGEDLFHSGIQALEQAGFADELAALPRSTVSHSEVWTKRRLAFSTTWRDDPKGEQGAFTPHTVPQPAMLQMITDAAAALPGFTLRMGAKVSQPLWDGDRIVGVEIQENGKREQLFADLVIGADGRTSALRHKAGMDPSDLTDAEVFDVAWTRAPIPTIPLDRSRLYLGSGRVFLILPTPHGEFQIGTVLEKGSFGDIRALGIEGWIEFLTDFVSDDVIAALRANASTIRLTLLDVVRYNLPEWSRPGLLLIGDAAHPMSPAGGQGLSQALRDAVAASNELAPVLAEHTPAPELVDAAARRVQVVRDPEVIAVQRIQGHVPKVLFQRTWYSRFLFSRALPLIARISPRLINLLIDRAGAPFHNGTEKLDLLPPTGPIRARNG